MFQAAVKAFTSDGLNAGCAVPGLQFVERAAQFTGQAGFVDAKVLQHAMKIAILPIEQLHQEMLDLNVVVSARETQPQAVFQGFSSGLVHLAEQRCQRGGQYFLFLPKRPQMSVLPNRGR